MPPHGSRPVYPCGDCKVDLVRQELRTDGVPIPSVSLRTNVPQRPVRAARGGNPSQPPSSTAVAPPRSRAGTHRTAGLRRENGNGIRQRRMRSIDRRTIGRPPCRPHRRDQVRFAPLSHPRDARPSATGSRPSPECGRNARPGETRKGCYSTPGRYRSELPGRRKSRKVRSRHLFGTGSGSRQRSARRHRGGPHCVVQSPGKENQCKLKPFVAIQRVRHPPGKGAARQPEASLARGRRRSSRSVGSGCQSPGLSLEMLVTLEPSVLRRWGQHRQDRKGRGSVGPAGV